MYEAHDISGCLSSYPRLCSVGLYVGSVACVRAACRDCGPPRQECRTLACSLLPRVNESSVYFFNAHVGVKSLYAMSPWEWLDLCTTTAFRVCVYPVALKIS